ncbi:MAG: ArsR/SmtB family transcription factor [Lautropia sp.]
MPARIPAPIPARIPSTGSAATALSTNDLARVAGLVGEPARSAMLLALMDGRALTANELARGAGVAASTASRHLALVVDGGLLVAPAAGRHRYHRLASPQVAATLEGLMQLASRPAPARLPIVTGPRDAAMRQARTCYDHLAGRLGVAIAEHLAVTGAIELDLQAVQVTPALPAELARIGLELPADATAARAAAMLSCRPCMDWAERRPHLAGAAATRLCRHLFERGWLRRAATARSVGITGDGARHLGAWLGARRWSWVVDARA